MNRFVFLPVLLLVAGLVGLPAGALAQSAPAPLPPRPGVGPWGCDTHQYYPNWTSPGYLYSRPRYVPPVHPYVPLSNQDRYQSALRKGDEAADRGDWSKATAQYRDARDRASQAWGEGSKQALEAAELLRRAEFKARMRSPGQSSRKGYQEALERGRRARRRGQEEVARQAFREAIRLAGTAAEATQASALLREEELRSSPGARAGTWQVEVVEER